jgi:hypothetical protein
MAAQQLRSGLMFRQAAIREFKLCRLLRSVMFGALLRTTAKPEWWKASEPQAGKNDKLLATLPISPKCARLSAVFSLIFSVILKEPLVSLERFGPP